MTPYCDLFCDALHRSCIEKDIAENIWLISVLYENDFFEGLHFLTYKICIK